MVTIQFFWQTSDECLQALTHLVIQTIDLLLLFPNFFVRVSPPKTHKNSLYMYLNTFMKEK